MATKNRSRVIRTSFTSPAGLYIQDQSAALVGDHRHFVICDENGTTIRGPVSQVNDSMSRRTGGLFVGINDFLEMIPQTIITPIPSVIPFPPVFALVGIVSTVAFFTSLLF